MNTLLMIKEDYNNLTRALETLNLALADNEGYKQLLKIQKIYSESSETMKLTELLDNDVVLKQLKTAEQASVPELTMGVEFISILLKKFSNKMSKSLKPKLERMLVDHPGLMNARVDLYIKELEKLFNLAGDILPAYSKTHTSIVTSLPYQYYYDLTIACIEYINFLATIHPLADHDDLDDFSDQLEVKFNKIFKHRNLLSIENKKVRMSSNSATSIDLKNSDWINRSKLNALKNKTVVLYRYITVISYQVQKDVEQAMQLYKQVESNGVVEREQKKIVQALNRLQIYSALANSIVMISKRFLNMLVHSVLGDLVSKADPKHNIVFYRY